MATNGAGGRKCRYDLFDVMPPELRSFLRNSAFNWATEMVHDRMVMFQSVTKTLRSMRSKEVHRIRRDEKRVWNR